MGLITLTSDGFLSVSCEYEERDVVKEIGGRWDGVYKVWNVAFTVENLDFLLSNIRDVTISDVLEGRVEEQMEKEKKLKTLKEWARTDAPVRLKVPGLSIKVEGGGRESASLYNYQKIGVMYALTNGDGVLIADEMGLGKTLQAISAALILKDKGKIDSALIVTPASLKFNWPIEIDKFTEEKYVVIDGSPDERVAQWLRTDVFFYIVNYELLQEDLFGGRESKEKEGETGADKSKRMAKVIKGKKRMRMLSQARDRVWGLLAVDEAHMMKNGLSKRSKNVKRLKAKMRIALTGTPMDGRLEELHSVMDFVIPGLLESRTRFMQKHAIVDFWGKVEAYKDIGVVKEKIAPYFIRRLKKDVLKDLPDKIYENRMVLLTPAEQKMYKDLAENGHAATEDAEAMVCVIRCKQLCNHPMLLNDALVRDGMDSEVRLEKMKASKMEALREILDEVVIENGHKVVLFSQYKRMLDIIAKELKDMGIKFLRIDGDTDKKERADMQNRFNSDNAIDMMIGTEAMSTGFNFTRADYVVNYDDNWAPAFMAQREDRCIIGGQYIQTDKGMIKIEEVKIGDRVLTHKGKYERVIDCGNRLHRANTTGGLTTTIRYRRFDQPLVSTHDHLLLVLRDGKTDWMEASSVKPRDFLLCPVVNGENSTPKFIDFPERLSFRTVQTINGSDEFVNGRYHPLPREIEINDDFLLTVGWYIAEGFCSVAENKGKFVSFSGHTSERSILERIKKYAKETLGANGTIGPIRDNCMELRIYSSEMAVWFKEMFGDGCYVKKIPNEWVEGWGIEELWKILCAYVEGDGYFRKKQQEWVTVSHQLALQITKIAEMKGFQPSMRQVKSGKNKGHWICMFTVDGNPCSPLFRESINGYICLPVVEVTTKVESKKDIRVYDLTVENGESFVVGRATVHNCHRIGQKNVVTVINFVCRGTIEEKIRSVLYAKNKISAQALGDDLEESVLKRLGPKDIAKML